MSGTPPKRTDSSHAHYAPSTPQRTPGGHSLLDTSAAALGDPGLSDVLGFLKSTARVLPPDTPVSIKKRWASYLDNSHLLDAASPSPIAMRDHRYDSQEEADEDLIDRLRNLIVDDEEKQGEGDNTRSMTLDDLKSPLRVQSIRARNATLSSHRANSHSPASSSPSPLKKSVHFEVDKQQKEGNQSQNGDINFYSPARGQSNMLQYFERELKRTREQCAKLQSENERLSKAESKNKYLHSELEALKARNRRQYEEHQSETKLLQDNIREKDKTLNGMTGRLSVEDKYRNVLSEKTAFESRTNALERSLREMEDRGLREMYSQKEAVHENELLRREKDNLRDTLNRPNRESSERICLLQNANQEETKLLRTELDSTHDRAKDINTLQQELVRVKEITREHEEKCLSVENKNQDLLLQNGRMQQEIQELRTKQTEMDAYHSSLERERDEIEAKLRLYTEKNTALEVELQHAVMYSKKLLHSMEEMANDDRFAQLKREREELQRKADADLNSLKSVNGMLNRQIRELQNKISVKDVELKLLQEQLTTTKDSQTENRQQNIFTQEKLRQMVSELNGTRIDLNTKSEELEKIRRQYADLRAAKVDSDAQNEQYDALRTEHENAEQRFRMISEKLHAVTEECESLKRQQQQHHEQAEVLEMLGKQNHDLIEEKDKLLDKVQDLEEANNDKSVHLKVYETRLSDLTEQKRNVEEQTQPEISHLNITDKIDTVKGRMERDHERIYLQEQTIGRLETSLKKKENDNDKLQSKLQERMEKLRSLSEENRINMGKALQLDALEEHLGETRERIKKLQGELVETIRKNFDLETKVKTSQNHALDMKGELDNALVSIADSREQLQEKEQESADHISQLEIMKEETSSLKVQNKVLVEQKQSIMEELHASIETRDKQRTELGELRSKLESIRGNVDVYKQQLLVEGMNGDHRVQKLTDEIDRLREDRNSMRKQQVETESQYKALESEMETEQRRSKILIIEMGSLKENLDRCKEDAARLVEENNSRQLESSQIQTLLQDNDDAHARSTQLQQQSTELEKENHGLNMHIAVLESKLEHAGRCLKEIETQMETERSHSRRKNEFLQRELSTQRREREEMDHARKEANAKLEKMEKRIQELQGNIDTLREQKEELEASSILERTVLNESFHKQSQGVQDGIYSLHSELDTLREELTTVSNERQTLYRQNVILEQKLREYKEEHRQIETDLHILEQSNLGLQLQLEGQNSRVKKSMNSLSESQVETHRISGQKQDTDKENFVLHVRMKTLADDLEKARNMLAHERDTHDKAIKDFEERLAEEHHEGEVGRQLRTEFNERTEECDKSVERLVSLLADTKRDLAQRSEECGKLRFELAELQQWHNAAQIEKEKFQTDLEYNVKQYDALKVKLDRPREDVTQWERECRGSNEQLERLRSNEHSKTIMNGSEMKRLVEGPSSVIEQDRVFPQEFKVAVNERHRAIVQMECADDKKRMIQSYEHVMHKMHGTIKISRDLLEYFGDKLEQLLQAYRKQFTSISDRSANVELVTTLLRQADYMVKEQCTLGRKLADVKTKILVNDEQMENHMLDRERLEKAIRFSELKIELLRATRDASGQTLNENLETMESLLRDNDTHCLHVNYFAMHYVMEHNFMKDSAMSDAQWKKFELFSRRVEDLLDERGDGPQSNHFDLERYVPFMESMSHLLCEKRDEQGNDKLPIGSILDQVIAQETEGRLTVLRKRVVSILEEIREGRTVRRDELKQRQRKLTDRIKSMERELLECFAKCDSVEQLTESRGTREEKQKQEERFDFLMTTIDRLQLELDEKDGLLRSVSAEYKPWSQK